MSDGVLSCRYGEGKMSTGSLVNGYSERYGEDKYGAW